jgi:hypothetical protein
MTRPPARFVLLITVASALLALGVQDLQAQHFDVLAVQDADGKILTGAADFDNDVLTLPYRLFDRDIGDLAPGFGTDPGFNSVSQEDLPPGVFALPGGTPLAFDIVRFPIFDSTPANLWYWDGIDDDADDNYLEDVVFAPASGTTLSMTIFGAGGGTAVATGGNADVQGPTLQTTDANGGMHRHPNYQLSGGAPGGAYLLSLRLEMPGLTRSDPVFLLFVTVENGDINLDAYDAALEWAQDRLLLPGDVNNDGIVNIFDVGTVSEHWLQTEPNGDANFDGAVNIFDVGTISEHWMDTTLGSAAAVPEPSSIVLACTGLGFASCLLMDQRRKKRRR